MTEYLPRCTLVVLSIVTMSFYHDEHEIIITVTAPRKLLVLYPTTPTLRTALVKKRWRQSGVRNIQFIIDMAESLQEQPPADSSTTKLRLVQHGMPANAIVSLRSVASRYLPPKK